MAQPYQPSSATHPKLQFSPVIQRYPKQESHWTSSGDAESRTHPRQVVYWLRRSGEVADPDMRIAVEAGHFTEMLVLLVRGVAQGR